MYENDFVALAEQMSTPYIFCLVPSYVVNLVSMTILQWTFLPLCNIMYQGHEFD